jgi:sec-independent protein translocase protein TatC
VLAIAFAACIAFADEIFGFLVVPLTKAFPAGEGKLIYTKLYEAFFVEIKVALFAAFFVSFPVLANQMWAFVAPGLYAKEKKAFLPFLLVTPLFFFAGAALAYYVVMPTAFEFFLTFEGNKGGLQLEALPGTGDYLSLVMQFILAFGISFLLPVLLVLLHSAGIVTRAQLVLIPLMLLFEGALATMWVIDRRAAKDDLAEKSSPTGGGGESEANAGGG